MTHVLVSFCNQGLGRPPLALVDIEARTAQPVELDPGGAVTCTGLARAGDYIAVAFQAAQARSAEIAFLNPVTLAIHGRAAVRGGSDLHSLAWHDGTLYVASTGTDEVLGLRIEGGRVLAEEVVWRPATATERVDRHHINSVTIHQDRLHVVGYWPRSGPVWAGATFGRVTDVARGREIATDLHHPHSLTSIGADLYICESATRLLRQVGGPRQVELSGYARGLCAVGPWILAGTSKRRLRSRSTGVVNPAAPGEVTGSCGITILDAESFAILDFINLDRLSAEIYDLLPLGDIVRPRAAGWHVAASLQGRTPAYTIDAAIDARGTPPEVEAERPPLASATTSPEPAPAPAGTGAGATANGPEISSADGHRPAPPAPDIGATVGHAPSDPQALARRVSELEAQVRDLATLAESASAGWARAHELDRACAEAWEHAHKLDRDLVAALSRGNALERELNDSWAYARTLAELLAADRTTGQHAAAFPSALAVWDAEALLQPDRRFVEAFAAGRRAGHALEHPGGRIDERSAEWRTRVICWAAQHAARLDGSFVECRFDAGFYALAACRYLDFKALDRDFYLFDPVTGAPPGGVSYPTCCALLDRSVAEYPRLHLIRGIVPDTLNQVEIDRVGYLALDVRVAEPELGVLQRYWPKLVAGAIVVLEGYGWRRYAPQRSLVDAFAEAERVGVLALPTGQGLIFKP